MPRLTRRNLLWFGVGGAAAWGGWEIFKPMERVRMDMQIKLMQPFRDFFNNNKLDPKRYLYDRETGEPTSDAYSGTFFYETVAYDRDVFMEYDITIMNGDTIKLPTARTCTVDRVGGFIWGFSSYLPVENLTFDEAMIAANRLAIRLKEAGGKQTFFPKKKITIQAVAENNGMKFHSVWQIPLQGVKATSYYECQIEIISSQRFSGSTTPPAAALVTSARDKKTVYMINFDVKVSDEVRHELMRLGNARRFHETGIPSNSYIPLIEWYDDPDWRPKDWGGKFV